MNELPDDEFGPIIVRRLARARAITLSLNARGQPKLTAPRRTSLRAIERLINESRPHIRQLLAQHGAGARYTSGMAIGKQHSLVVAPGGQLQVRRQGCVITATVPAPMQLEHPTLQQAIARAAQAALRREAKHYLPGRLAALATQHGYTYQRVRFSHATSRWGSCSSQGTISLNIALMNLPFALIDYVLIHELCHTQQMDHSPAFWRLVAAADPHYQQHRQQLKRRSPII